MENGRIKVIKEKTKSQKKGTKVGEEETKEMESYSNILFQC